MVRSKLGELLIERGVLTQETLDGLLERQRVDSRRLGELLVGDGAADAAALRAALAEQLGAEVIDLVATPPEAAAHELLPAALVSRCEAVALSAAEGVLTVAMVDPANTLALDELRAATGYDRIDVRMVTAADFALWVREHHSTGPALDDAVKRGTEARLIIISPSPAAPEEGLAADPDSTPVVALLDHVLAEAVKRGATDIHLEPFETVSRVRLRIDGSMITLITPPRRLHAPLVQRLRQLIGERRGELRMELSGRQTSFRGEIVDTFHGPEVILRAQSVALRTLDELELPSTVSVRIERLLQVPRGLVLVAGGRGTGRSTTALAVAHQVNRRSRQVCHVTDGAAAALSGATLIRAGGGRSMEDAVRDGLALNPDVLVVDGIRGPAVGSLVARAALDGHLVVATLGGGRAIDSLLALLGSGVPGYAVAASLRCVIAQRLCRRADPASATAYEPSAAELEEFGIPPRAAAHARFRQVQPAPTNHGTGYLGRIGVHEVLFGTPALRAALRDGADADALRALAQADGFHSLWEDAVAKIMRGETTFEEVRAVLSPPA